MELFIFISPFGLERLIFERIFLFKMFNRTHVNFGTQNIKQVTGSKLETKNYLGADKARHDAIVILITLSIKCFNYQCLRHFRSNDDNDEQKYG